MFTASVGCPDTGSSSSPSRSCCTSLDCSLGVTTLDANGTYRLLVSLLLLFNQGPVYKQLLDSALVHAREGRPRESVVFAQIAAETVTDAVLTQLVATVEPLELRPWLLDWLARSSNPDNDQVRRLYAALTGVSLHEQPWWSDYKAAYKLRNKVTHAGAHVSQEEAMRAVASVQALVAFLTDSSSSSS